MYSGGLALACAAACAAVSPVMAQQAESVSLQQSPAPAAEGVQTVTVPALSPVTVEILANLSSKTSKSGERFPIRLAEPILVDGREIVPAGVMGEGEVVHAKKSGGMGAAGELVLAARHVEHGGQRIALRSLKLTPLGRSAVNTVNAINVGSVASPLPVGLIGFFISGGQAVVTNGTLATAKIAADTPIPVPVSAQAISQTPQASTEEETIP